MLTSNNGHLSNRENKKMNKLIKYNKQNNYKFVMLVHSTYVAEVVHREALAAGWDIATFVTSYETAEEDAEKLIRQGFEILICHGGFRYAILRRFGSSTVFIERSDLDIIKALLKARQYTSEVALTAYEDEPRDIEFMKQLTAMRIHEVRYADHHELEKKLTTLYSQGIRVAVGGGGTARIMQRLGGQTFLDEPHPSNIRQSINRAAALTDARRMEHNYVDNIKEILKFIKEGVICVNRDGKEIYANDMAASLLSPVGQERFKPYYGPLFIEAVLGGEEARIDEVVVIRGKRLLVNTFPIYMNAKAGGAVAFVHDVLSLQKISCKIADDLNQRGLTSRYTVNDILGISPEILGVRARVLRYGPVNTSIYINGETGTGKELVAHALHAASPRASGPFVAVNCAALPESLLDSELFGYEEGAFTDAKRGGKAGLFELAHKGTLFLDEIASISPAMQIRLLRVLEAREIMRVGGNRIIPVDVRIISASQHNQLSELLRQGAFRLDLYYRLVGLSIAIAPLRERREDILFLAAETLKRCGKSPTAITPFIRKMLLEHSWPGNVRELLSIMENYSLLLGNRAADDTCFNEIFEERGRLLCSLKRKRKSRYNGSLRERIAVFRATVIRETLEECGGNRKRAAEKLGVGYTTLRRLLSEKD